MRPKKTKIGDCPRYPRYPLADTSATSPPRRVDVAILTVREDEFRAVLDVFPNQPELYQRRRHYNLRTADAGGGRTYRIAIVRQVEQGNGEAQDAARDIVDDLQPQLLLLVGIAGGLPSDDFTLGDVIVSTRINDYCVEARKEGEAPSYSSSGGPVARDIATGVANLPARESELGDWGRTVGGRPEIDVGTAEVCGPLEWQELVREKLRHHFGENRVRLPWAIAGTLASSDRLVKDPTVLFPWIQTARHILAIEMESGGVYRAVRERTMMVAIRGVSDIIGLKRDDRWTKYACASAAAFTRAYLRIRPVPPSESITPSRVSRQRRHKDQPPQVIQTTLERAPDMEPLANAEPGPALASVLLPYQVQGLFMVEKNEAGRRKVFNSLEGLVSVLEEFLALGCLHVAVPAGTIVGDSLANLSFLKGRLLIVDEDKATYNRVVSVLAPVAEELQVPQSGFVSEVPALPAHANALVNEKDTIRKQRIALLSYVTEHTYELLLGLRHHLQIELDIREFVRQTIALREALRSPAARLNLSSIAGLLRSYEAWNVQTLDMMTTDRIARTESSLSLARDQTFRHLSHQAHLLGVPLLAKNAADRLSELALQLIAEARDPRLATKSRLIRASGSIREPGNELEQEVFTSGFVPPIVPLRGLVLRAKARWEKDLPPGYKAVSFQCEGREGYFPASPIWCVSKVASLHLGLRSTTPVRERDVDFFEASMALEAECAEHVRLPSVKGRIDQAGILELEFSFCCEEQFKHFMKGLTPVHG